MSKSRMISHLCLFVFLGSASARGENFLPLETGNEWTYREPMTNATMTVRVGLPALIGGNVYYRVTGYVTQPVWVRQTENGNLYYRDEERDRDALLTSFEFAGGGWFEAPLRICEQQGQAEERRLEYSGGAGRIPGAIRLRYRSFRCADAGVEEEVYAGNVGMLSRVMNTFTGPRRYELVSARVGKQTLLAEPYTAFQLAVRPAESGEPRLIATLRAVVNAPQYLVLRYPSSQEFEVVLRDEGGRELWRWSDGKAFLPVIQDRQLGPGERTWTVEIPMRALNGSILPGGFYTVEAWLTAGERQRDFAAIHRLDWKRPGQ